MNLEQIVQAVIVGITLGALYALMATGITFIASILKLINWAMGDFFMVGTYVQLVVLTAFIGQDKWYLGVPITMAVTFVVGVLVQRTLLAPMFRYGEANRFEYATIMTIALSLLLQNGAVLIAGPNQASPAEYLPSVPIPGLGISVNGSRIAAAIGAAIILIAFWLFLRRTLFGLSLLGAAQNRLGAQTAGIRLGRLDMTGFGIGVALAAAAGALLAPVYSVYPGNGQFAITKGFEIIVIGGLGSLPGAVIAAFMLAMVESIGSALVSPLYQDLYGFLFLMLFLIMRPTGLFGERERRV